MPYWLLMPTQTKLRQPTWNRYWPSARPGLGYTRVSTKQSLGRQSGDLAAHLCCEHHLAPAMLSRQVGSDGVGGVAVQAVAGVLGLEQQRNGQWR